MKRRFEVGDVARLTAHFTSQSVSVDPTTVRALVLSPSGVEQQWTYGVGDKVQRLSAGMYRVLVPLDESGTWHWRWEGAGDHAAAAEGQLWVAPSAFA